MQKCRKGEGKKGMENKVMKFYSKAGNNIILRAVPGHFATSHSHINYYVDMTGLKTRRSEAAAVGKAFVQGLPGETVVDTVCCLDGCEVIGAYVAEELERGNFPSMNMHNTVYVVTPEFNMNNQMIFRDNLVGAIRNDAAEKPGVHRILRRKDSGHLFRVQRSESHQRNSRAVHVRYQRYSGI